MKKIENHKSDSRGYPAPRIPFSFARRHGIFLLPAEGEANKDIVRVLAKSKLSLSLYSEIRRFTNMPLSIELVSESVFDEELTSAYEGGSSQSMQAVEDISDELAVPSLAESMSEAEDLLEQEDEAPIIRLINAILTEAIQSQASDVHLETYEKNLSVRFRIDGILREMVQPKRALAILLVSRIKVMAGLDIAEKRVPQDGRISIKLGGREIDVRVSTLPSIYGERIVMRLLDRKQAGKIGLPALGMSIKDQHNFKRLLGLSHGIFLVTGPTGSGKSTTLYAGLTEINDRKKNILTVEDPVEYYIQGIGQTQVNNKAGMTFSKGLRAILRQDPDVLMVGEIRDLETVQIAVQASLTGHLVLTTLHTNTAVGAVTRLMDMGVEPFLLSSSVVGVLSQRLVRKLCLSCRQPHEITKPERSLLNYQSSETLEIYKAASAGCEACKGAGYLGRNGIYELINIDDELRALIHDRASEASLLAKVRQRNSSIRQDGFRQVIAGTTSIEEVLRVTQEI